MMLLRVNISGLSWLVLNWAWKPGSWTNVQAEMNEIHCAGTSHCSMDDNGAQQKPSELTSTRSHLNAREWSLSPTSPHEPNEYGAPEGSSEIETNPEHLSARGHFLAPKVLAGDLLRH